MKTALLLLSAPRRGVLKAVFGALGCVAVAAPAAAHDYPTVERVIYVQECVRQHPGPHFEMLNKCSCVIDKIASQVPVSEFDTMSTAANANSIGGERGNAIRDAESLQIQIRRFREIQTTAKKSCFINVDAK